MPPTVHFVKRAREAHGSIRRGQSYYWWKFRRGSKVCSKTRPLASQLTQSPFWSSLYAIQESLTSFSGSSDPGEVESKIDSLKEELTELRDETQQKVDNQPDSMASGPIAELLSGRVEVLDECISTLEGLDSTDEGAWDAAREAVESVSCE